MTTPKNCSANPLRNKCKKIQIEVTEVIPAATVDMVVILVDMEAIPVATVDMVVILVVMEVRKSGKKVSTCTNFFFVYPRPIWWIWGLFE